MPLRDVIGAAQVVLQTGRLKVASVLNLADTLVTDLQAFDPKPVARGLDLSGGRNADLVFALAVALRWPTGSPGTMTLSTGRGRPKTTATAAGWGHDGLVIATAYNDTTSNRMTASVIQLPSYRLPC